MYLNKKRLFLVISICLLFFFLTYNDVRSNQLTIISGIAEVVDGDTIKINSNKIRLFGIDAPEKKQFCKKIYLTISNTIAHYHDFLVDLYLMLYLIKHKDCLNVLSSLLEF